MIYKYTYRGEGTGYALKDVYAGGPGGFQVANRIHRIADGEANEGEPRSYIQCMTQVAQEGSCSSRTVHGLGKTPDRDYANSLSSCPIMLMCFLFPHAAV